MTQPQPNSQNDSAAAAIATALGRIPSGLFVVTWRLTETGGEPQDRGMLASWIMQGGFVPPLITIAIGVSRDLLAAIDQRLPFVINVLGESQRPLVARFGRPAAAGEDPFEGLRIERTANGIAILADTSAWLECLAITQTSGGGEQTGDHTIILARVVSAGAGPDQPPLVHVRRNGLRY